MASNKFFFSIFMFFFFFLPFEKIVWSSINMALEILGSIPPFSTRFLGRFGVILELTSSKNSLERVTGILRKKEKKREI